MKLALIGCGLLGGSLAGAWRASGRITQVSGFDADPRRAARAAELGLLDTVAASAAQAAGSADCVAIATPVGSIEALLAALAPRLGPSTIVTDVASTKARVVASAAAVLGQRMTHFVPAHPIAGGELPGVEHARADLFASRWVITTPQPGTDPGALAWVEQTWRACGARVERMSASEHDEIFARVSHLPHVLAFALVDQLARTTQGKRAMRFAGPGFRDFSRIAAGDPTLWRDIALANRDAIAAALRDYRGELDALQAAVDRGDGAALMRIFEAASRARRAHANPAVPGNDDAL